MQMVKCKILKSLVGWVLANMHPHQYKITFSRKLPFVSLVNHNFLFSVSHCFRRLGQRPSDFFLLYISFDSYKELHIHRIVCYALFSAFVSFHLAVILHSHLLIFNSMFLIYFQIKKALLKSIKESEGGDKKGRDAQERTPKSFLQAWENFSTCGSSKMPQCTSQCDSMKGHISRWDIKGTCAPVPYVLASSSNTWVQAPLVSDSIF